jgi:flagellar hook-associated protein 2
MGLVNSSSGSLETIIQQYMTLEKRPLSNIQAQKSKLQSRIATFTSFKSQLDSMQKVAKNIKDEDSSSFSVVKVNSSDAEKVSVTAGDNTAEGTYDIRVRQLATTTTMRSTARLNTAVSVKSLQQVVAGGETLDTSLSWEEAGFSTTPTGTVSFDSGSGWVEFTLDDYDSVDDFIDAVNGDSVAGANIYYNESSDKFVIENDVTGGTLKLKQSTADGFLTQAKISDSGIIADTNEHSFATNNSGLQTSALLSETNFDSTLADTDSGSFKINGATIEWDADQDTFADIIYRINSSEADVTAFYNESVDKITITSNTTGAEEILFEDVEGDFLGDVLKLDGVVQDVGDNALFTINSDSAEDQITETSNSFTLNGLKIELNQVTVANDSYSDADTESTKITSERDVEAIESNIKSFLNTFNGVMDYLKDQMKVNTTTYSRGALAGESLVRNLRSNMMNKVLQEITGISDGDPKTLSGVGISLDNNLHLVIDDATELKELLTSSPTKVADLFQGENGIATSVYDLLDEYTETYDGLIDQRTDLLEDRVSEMDTRMERMNERLAVKESQYRAQLTSLQSMYIQVVQQQSLVTNIVSAAASVTQSLYN